MKTGVGSLSTHQRVVLVASLNGLHGKAKYLIQNSVAKLVGSRATTRTASLGIRKITCSLGAGWCVFQ
jgi:hypothetical protein